MHLEQEDSIYNKSFFDLKDSMPQLSTLMSQHFEQNQNTQNYLNQSELQKSLATSQKKAKHFQRFQEQLNDNSQENQLLKYIVKSVEKYVNDLEISQNSNFKISSIQISQQKRAINKSPQFGTRCSGIQISQIKKSIIQNLFTIKEDAKQDEEQIFPHNDIKSIQHLMYCSRKRTQKNSSNQLQGLSSIDDKQLKQYQNLSNIDVQQFDIKQKAKSKQQLSPSPSSIVKKQQSNKIHIQSQKILQKNIQYDSSDLNHSHINQSMKKSVESIIMDEEFINLIVPSFSINKIEHHRFPSFSNDLKIKFAQFQKQKAILQKRQRIKLHFLNAVDEGLKLNIHKLENNICVNFAKAQLKKDQIRQIPIVSNSFLKNQKIKENNCTQKINKIKRSHRKNQSDLPFHKLNYSKKTFKQRQFSTRKENQEEASKCPRISMSKQYCKKDIMLNSRSLKKNKNEIKHNQKGISLMKKTLNL